MKNELKPATSAFPDNHVVRLTSGIYCPCGRPLRASDVEIIGTDVLLICEACQHDVLTIECDRSR